MSQARDTRKKEKALNKENLLEEIYKLAYKGNRVLSALYEHVMIELINLNRGDEDKVKKLITETAIMLGLVLDKDPKEIAKIEEEIRGRMIPPYDC
jgi:hypothetical protein